jgi:hypothetical protein
MLIIFLSGKDIHTCQIDFILVMYLNYFSLTFEYLGYVV